MNIAGSRNLGHEMQQWALGRVPLLVPCCSDRDNHFGNFTLWFYLAGCKEVIFTMLEHKRGTRTGPFVLIHLGGLGFFVGFCLVVICVPWVCF